MTVFGALTDEAAAGYDAWSGTPVGRLSDRLEKASVFRLLKDAPGRAIDFSCGTGNYALELARRGWSVVGIDTSLPMLRQARRNAGADRRVRLVLGDAAALPVRSGSIDLITLILGLEFMADPGRALAEVRRVLRPSRVLIVATLAPRGLWNIWRRIKRRLIRSLWREVRFLADGELRALLAGAGLVPVATSRAVHYVPPISWAPLLALWERVADRLAPSTAAFRVLRCTPSGDGCDVRDPGR